MNSNIERLNILKNNLSKKLNNLNKSVIDEADKKFYENGGCKVCRGRGWIVIWDTMDSSTGCYHDWSGCSSDDCNRESRKLSGLSPKNNKYDKFHQGSTWSLSYTKDQKIEKANIDLEINRLSREIEDEKDRIRPAPGKVVTVTSPGRGAKHRRVPVGTVGIIKKMHTNNWGTTKAIIVDKKGNQWWPSIKQIEVTDANPDISIWNKLDKEARETNGLPVIVTIKKKTQRAALVKTTTSKEIWIPYSQVPELKTFDTKQTVSVSVPMWLAKKNNLIKVA